MTTTSTPTSVRDYLATKGLSLAPYVGELRPNQEAAREWGRRSTKRNLLINAPTGSGKTLLLGLLGCDLGQSWTYGTHSIRLQGQVESTFPGLPVATGRANHACLIGMETHKRPDITAAEGICVALQWCEYSGWPARTPSQETQAHNVHGQLCNYYAQRQAAFESHWRTANYSYILADHRSFVESGATDVLLCDEAHSVDEAVSRAAEMELWLPAYKKYGISPPATMDPEGWRMWAERQLWHLPPGTANRLAPDMQRVTIRQQLTTLATMYKPEEWMVERTDKTIRFRPLWGRSLTKTYLMGEGGTAPPQRAIFTSATLIGAEYFADRLGLEDNSWDYLELSHTFPASNRPVNFSPILAMSAATQSEPAARKRMQDAMDYLCQWYLLRGTKGIVIHAVSNIYRNLILQESRWRDMMTSDTDEHEAHIDAGESSILVAANVLEGWDGTDEYCGLTIMPKVPFGNLGDKRVRLQMEADPRSYDYTALIGVIQGSGRGTRHETDHSDTWILDENFDSLYKRRGGWLPTWFKDAFHYRVAFPE